MPRRCEKQRCQDIEDYAGMLLKAMEMESTRSMVEGLKHQLRQAIDGTAPPAETMEIREEHEIPSPVASAFREPMPDVSQVAPRETEETDG